MATLLTCQGVTKAYGTRVLFDQLSVSFADDERVGLLGPNGSGKTTLLKILGDEEPVDAGVVNRRRAARIVLLPQRDLFAAGATAGSVLSTAIADTHPEEHERDTQVNIMLTRFGLGSGTQEVATLSGGWRKRLAVARAFIREPDLLMMDEPTNHLDMEGIVWLEEQLARIPFAFVVVSHDRYFLERVTNRVVELNPRYPDGFFSVAGSYGTFLDKRADFLDAQQAQEAALANIVRRESAFLKSQAKARRTKSKSRIDEAYRLKDELREIQQRNRHKAAAAIDFDSTGRKSKLLMEANGLSKSLGDHNLFENLDVSLAPGTRLGVLGGNGSGKTTLLRVLGGELPPDTGTIRTADDLRVTMFDQKRESLPQDQPLRRALAADGESVEFRGQSLHITGWAKRFLFRTEQINLPVAELSGGEQARVLIARLMLQPADLLILDEPTNDLDIASLDILEESLISFPGAVILVTHDRFMLDRICNEVIGLDGGGVANRYANCDQWLASRARRGLSGGAQDDTLGAAGGDQPQNRPAKKRLRGALTASEESELKEMEERILEAEAEVESCRQAMEDPAFAADPDETAKRWQAHGSARAAVDALYARWEELEGKAG